MRRGSTPTFIAPEPQWDVHSPEIRRTLRVFEAEINRFEGPWKFELWMLANGCIDARGGFPYFQVIEVKLTDGKVFRKPEYTKLTSKAGPMIEKYRALQILQKMTKKAVALQTGPAPEMQPAGMNL